MQATDFMRDRPRWGLFVLAAAALLVLFLPAVRFSIAMFRDPFEDLGHGWIIPFVSGYAIWRMRRQLQAEAGVPAWCGLLAVAGCLILFWLGNRGEQARLMQFGMIGCVAALPWAFWGAGVARRLLFPAAYMLFILPTSFLDVLTFKLRLLSAWLACGVLNGLGIAVQQVGTAMLATAGDGFKLDVADPCSGMRSIFALAALTAAYACFTQTTRLRQWLLFACAVPLAIIGNIVRLVSTGLVAHIWGQAAAVRYHDGWGGYPGFVIAVLLMMQAGTWIRRIGRDPRATDKPAPARPEAGTAAPSTCTLRALGPCWATLVLAGACFAAVSLTPPPTMEPDTFIAAALPAQVDRFTGQTPWFCQNAQCLASFNEKDLPAQAGDPPRCLRCGQPLARISLGERQILPADTRILKRNYLRGDGLQLSATVVVSGKSRLSIHRPEMCLPGQGFNIQSSQVRELDLGGGRHLRVNVVTAARAGQRPIGFLYWFVSPRGETPSHWRRIFSDVWDRSVHNRLNRWSMVTVFGNLPVDDPEAFGTIQQFVAGWYPQILSRERSAAADR